MTSSNKSVALLQYNFRLGRLIWVVGALLCLGTPTMFCIAFGGSPFREGVPFAWFGWYISTISMPLLAALLGAELYGRDAVDGCTLFLMTLPVTRFSRQVHRGALLSLLLVFWFATNAGVAIVLSKAFEKPPQWNWEEIALLTVAFYCSAFCAASISAAAADRTGNVALAVIIGLTITGGVFGVMSSLLHYSLSVMAAAFVLLGLACLTALLRFQLDVEIDKR